VIWRAKYSSKNDSLWRSEHDVGIDILFVAKQARDHDDSILPAEESKCSNKSTSSSEALQALHS
jgi:hypothetical protein